MVDAANFSVPGKILLFGEYSVLTHKKALAVPFQGFRLTYKEDKNFAANKLVGFYNSLLKDFPGWFDAQRIQQLISSLKIVSNIPVSYGAGSSGAICAWVLKYAGVKDRIQSLINNLPELRNFLASMECYFHGKSSGTDPLVIFLNKPVYINGHAIELPDINLNKLDDHYNAFLFDTGIPSVTASLVTEFQNNMQDKAYAQVYQDDYLPRVESCINAFINNNYSNDFQRSLKELSAMQMELFSFAIPQAFINIWKQLNHSGQAFMKLCGSGGGGFLLMFVPKNIQFDVEAFGRKRLIPIGGRGNSGIG